VGIRSIVEDGVTMSFDDATSIQHIQGNISSDSNASNTSARFARLLLQVRIN
jgi:hypothetical protein